MNEDRIVGAGREMLGKAERTVGGAVASDQLQKEGVVDQVAGAVQHGYGKAKDAIDGFVDEVPDNLGKFASQARETRDRADAAIRRELGDNGPLYVLAGAAALLGLGLLAISRRPFGR